jgi:hypothetical protein
MPRNERKMDMLPFGEEPCDDYLGRESDTPMTEAEQAAYAKGWKAGMLQGWWDGRKESQDTIALLTEQLTALRRPAP